MKPKNVQDFWVYVCWFRIPSNPKGSSKVYGVDVQFEKGTKNTIACFVDLDGRGKLKSNPKHPRLLRAAVLGKRLLNMQIKEWAQDYNQMYGLRRWEIEESFPWLPEWVYVALERQASRS